MFHRRHWLTGLAALPLARAVSDAAPAPARERSHEPAASDPGRRGFPPSLSGREILRQRSFPNVVLTTSEGKRVRFYDDLLKDKVVVLNLMYADCNGICPTTTANLKRVQQILRTEIAHDIFLYSLTIKPEEDTPDKLRDYAKMHGVRDPHWLFLTGAPNDVEQLRQRLGFADPNPVLDQDKARHSGMLRYGNEPLAIWGTCQGSAEPEWIAQEIGFAIPRKFKRHPRVNE